MASQLINRFFWVTPGGLPAVGYQLWSYAAGTSTPLPTYPTEVDAVNRTNANANPTILDALGSASIWLANVAAPGYKIILQDALGNVVWTQDNIDQGGVSPEGKSMLSVVQDSPLISAVDSTNVFWGLNTQVPSVELDARGEFTTANGRFTTQAYGIYKITLNLQLYTNGATLRAANSPTLGLQLNGVVLQQRVLGAPSTTGTNNPLAGVVTRLLSMNAGDYIR